ncbi:MAG: 50S ribosomal protein L18 [Candidatus Micrarchaeia archaeon]
MAKIVKVTFKRKRNKLTNYKKRLALVKSNLNRIVIRSTNKRVLAQIVKYSEKGDIVLVSAYSNELSKFGWPSRSNKPTAYLTGLLLAQKASEKKLEGEEYILDIGLSVPVKNSTPFVFMQGCIDGGLKLRSGSKIEEKNYKFQDSYINKLKENKALYEKQFSGYIKQKISPEELNKLFNSVKEKMLNA